MPRKKLHIPKRIYTAYTNPRGKQGLPWSSLVMMALMVREEPLSAIEIAKDISGHSKTIAERIYGMVHSSLRNLESSRYVNRTDSKKYEVSTMGEEVFSKYIDNSLSFSEQSDSKVLAKRGR